MPPPEDSEGSDSPSPPQGYSALKLNLQVKFLDPVSQQQVTELQCRLSQLFNEALQERGLSPELFLAPDDVEIQRMDE